jgi:hypothetical protein
MRNKDVEKIMSKLRNIDNSLIIKQKTIAPGLRLDIKNNSWILHEVTVEKSETSPKFIGKVIKRLNKKASLKKIIIYLK